MASNIHPTGVKADRNQRRVTISWSDGYDSTYSFDGLRLACPCVECKGGHANMGRATPRAAVRDAEDTGINLVDIQVVGSYALQPTWSDGHSTGLYSWELLRAIDPDPAWREADAS
jgi:DUF971 family protein